MGLMDNIRKQIGSQFIEILEWLDDTTDTLVWRFPVFNQEIKMGAQLVVRHKAPRLADHLAVQRMAVTAIHLHHHGLLHLVAGHLADQPATIALHFCSPSEAASCSASSRSRSTVSIWAMVRRIAPSRE